MVMDIHFVKSEAHKAYNVLIDDGWTPGEEVQKSWPQGEFPRQRYHDELYDLAREHTKWSQAATGEAIKRIMDQGGEREWRSLWLNTTEFLWELEASIESMRYVEGKPIEFYMDPDKVKKVYRLPVRTGYTKLCKFYRQGTCRNGDQCEFEHRRYGEGWPERDSTAVKVLEDDGEDIGKPPNEEEEVDIAQEERDLLNFRNKYGKGSSKGETTTDPPPLKLCLYYRTKNGCKYGPHCKFGHDDDATLKGHRETGKWWDNASRSAIRQHGFHKMCSDYQVHNRCRKAWDCKYSHEQLPPERKRLLRHLDLWDTLLGFRV